MVKHCEVCDKRHDPSRPHCPQCGRAMVQQQRDCIFGWGCGNQWHGGCGFWIPNNPRDCRWWSRGRYREREFCCECAGFVPHHFWIYDEESERWGKMLMGDWFCVKCFGPLPSGRENVQKNTPLLTSPARLPHSPLLPTA